MKIDLDELVRRYKSMSDEEFKLISPVDLSPEAQPVYHQELGRRGLPAWIAPSNPEPDRNAERKSSGWLKFANGVAFTLAGIVLLLDLLYLSRETASLFSLALGIVVFPGAMFYIVKIGILAPVLFVKSMLKHGRTS